MVLKKYILDNSFPVLNVLALSLSNNTKGKRESPFPTASVLDGERRRGAASPLAFLN